MSLKDTQAALGIILANYQGGLLVIEDINKFISDSLPNDLIGSIITQRHVSVDVITHFQSIGKAAHPKLWANCNYLRFHKCDDTVERHKSKFGGPVEHLKILEKMVDIEYEKGNKRFFAYLDKDNGNVKGPFNRTLFRHAIEGYLTDNYGIVTKEINRKHLHSGKAVHPSHQSAVKYLINGLEKRYYGNQV